MLHYAIRCPERLGGRAERPRRPVRVAPCVLQTPPVIFSEEATK